MTTSTPGAALAAMEPPLWLVMRIGCLECAMSSGIIGIFRKKEVAEYIAAKLNDNCDWDIDPITGYYGEMEYIVCETPELDTIDPAFACHVSDLDLGQESS